LAYVIGTGQLTLNGLKGKPVTNRLEYMTVWKKQSDGKWGLGPINSPGDPLAAMKEQHVKSTLFPIRALDGESK
jgi:ketosteroid isomerase-like protein